MGQTSRKRRFSEGNEAFHQSAPPSSKGLKRREQASSLREDFLPNSDKLQSRALAHVRSGLIRIQLCRMTNTARILHTNTERDMNRIVERDVQAVIYSSLKLPEWLVALSAAVDKGVIQIPRTILHSVTHAQIRVWLDHHLPEQTSALKDDILGLCDRVAVLTGSEQFQFRIFTETPTTNCGFHVDTVPPGAPAIGALRVYCGAGTEYVDPENVKSMQEFYRYLGRRERLEREREEAHCESNQASLKRVALEISRLDEELAFLLRSGEVHVTPVAAIVMFKHLDIRFHWSDHSKSLAWIHCSPMAGRQRLVVNVLPADAGARTGPAPREMIQ